MQDSEGQADHLQILGAGGGRDDARLGANIEDDGLLQPWDQEVCALVDDSLLHTGNSVEDNRPRTTLDVVDGVLEKSHTNSCRDGELGEHVQPSCRHCEYRFL